MREFEWTKIIMSFHFYSRWIIYQKITVKCWRGFSKSKIKRNPKSAKHYTEFMKNLFAKWFPIKSTKIHKMELSQSHWHSGLVFSRVSITSWIEETSIALIGHPPRDRATIKILYVVGVYYIYQLCTSFPSGLVKTHKRDSPFHCTTYVYSHADWDRIPKHLREVPWDIFKNGASVAAAEFC